MQSRYQDRARAFLFRASFVAAGVMLAQCADLDATTTLEGTGTDASDAPAADGLREVSIKGESPFTGIPDHVELAGVNHWFIELKGAPMVDGGDRDSIDERLEAFRSAAFAAQIKLRERFRFDGLVHGLTVRMDSAELPKLAKLEHVRAVYPVGNTSMPKITHTSEPQLATALGMTGADTVQNELGFDGTGIKIGIIDSGIDLEHPDFAGRIIGGFDFVGDAYDSNNPDLPPVPEPGEGSRPGGDDCGGHGTHVAGIAAAGGDNTTGAARGVAPGALLSAYRVFGCDGSTSDDVIVQAIERAYEDGMDVVNLSLGSNNGWPQDFLSLALSRVLDLGMIPVASAGNNGRSGTWTVGSPAAGENVITVASYDNLFTRSKKLELPDGTAAGYSVLSGAPQAPTDGTSEAIVYVGRGCAADTYVAEPTGKVALITRGACGFNEKYQRAFDAGAVGVIIENNAPGGFAGTLGGESDRGFGISISQESGAALRALITAGSPAFIRWTDEVLNEPNPTGDLISAFSSYGLAPDLALKPEIGAPGGLIRSTWPLDREDGESAGYAVLSGTSMSSPYVTGAVALLLQARPDIAPTQVRGVLQNTAEPKAWFGDRTVDVLDSVHRQGAGMIRIDRAVQSSTVVSPSKLSLGESQAGPYENTLYIKNGSDQEVTYTFANVTKPLATYGNPFQPQFAETVADVIFTRVSGENASTPIESITVPAGGARAISVRITAPADLPDGGIYGGYLTATPVASEGSTANAVSVPYAGFKGDYQQVDALSIAPVLLAPNADGVDAPVEEGYVYSMKGADRPGFALGLLYGVQTLTAELLPYGDTAWIGAQPAFSVNLLRRNNPGAITPFSSVTFDSSELPDGIYTVRIKLLKALGDSSNPAHYTVVETPKFKIAR